MLTFFISYPSANYRLTVWKTPLITVPAVTSNPNQMSPEGYKQKNLKNCKISQLPDRLISELHYEHKLAKRYWSGKNNMRYFWGCRRFCHSRVPIQPQSTTALKLMRRNHKVLKIRRKALTDRFCSRPEMTLGTPPRIIFLLVAPAACSLTAEKDTGVVGGHGHRWAGWEEQDASIHRRQPTADSRGLWKRFIWISSQAHIVSSMSRPAAPQQKGAEPQTSAGTEALPGLAVSNFFKWAQLQKRLRNSVLDLKIRASLKSHYLAHC